MIDINLLLAWGAAYKKINAEEIIFKEGQPCSFYYQLVSGKVRWVNVDEYGKECIHAIIAPEESFGELPLFDEENYAATAIAVKDSIVIRLHKPTFHLLLKENTDILFSFTKILAKRVRFNFTIINALTTHCPENIIATLINNFKAEKRNFCNSCNQLKLTRQQIADMTGLRVETVIRTMRNMHEKGELVISKGKVYCNDRIERIYA
jgi:CRP/FNR family transcriptional regulator, cyclic AMP receptor protein